MSSNTYASVEGAVGSTARQLQLFPFDQWGAENAVVVVECPHPGIARAMIGPLVLGHTSQRVKCQLRCIAVAADGALAASTWVQQAQLNDPMNLWSIVVGQLDMARKRPTPIANPIWRATPDDCLKAWSDPQHWLSAPNQGDPIHRAAYAMSKLLARQALESQSILTRWDWARIEIQAQALVSEQISGGMQHLLAALDPALCLVLTNRPRLSISMAQQLIALAKQHGTTAVTYALQALRTESLGLIHLITSGYPEREAREAREAIFNGISLPDALSEFGVAKAIHRQTVHKPARDNDQVLSWSDIPIAGQNWLTAMRLTTFLPPPSKANWAEFSRLVELILELNIQRTVTAENLLKWCIQADYANSCDRLTNLLDQAQAFRSACKGWANVNLPFEDALDLALAVDQPEAGAAIFGADFSGYVCAGDLYQLALWVAHISGQSIHSILHPLFNLNPGVPSEFKAPEHFTVLALNELDTAMCHGVDCENCIQEPASLVQYLAEGVSLYGVRSTNGVVGTIALRCDCSEQVPMVQVQEVSGVHNEAAEFELCHLAQSLADACNSPWQIEKWIAYEDTCAHWRDLAMHTA